MSLSLARRFARHPDGRKLGPDVKAQDQIEEAPRPASVAHRQPRGQAPWPYEEGLSPARQSGLGCGLEGREAKEVHPLHSSRPRGRHREDSYDAKLWPDVGKHESEPS